MQSKVNSQQYTGIFRLSHLQYTIWTQLYAMHARTHIDIVATQWHYKLKYACSRTCIGCSCSCTVESVYLLRMSFVNDKTNKNLKHCCQKQPKSKLKLNFNDFRNIVLCSISTFVYGMYGGNGWGFVTTTTAAAT